MTKVAIVRILGQVLKIEIATVCSDDFKSLRRDKSKEAPITLRRLWQLLMMRLTATA